MRAGGPPAAPAEPAHSAGPAPAASTRHDQHAHHARPGAGTSAFEREMDESMDRMMEAMHADGYSGHADADFLAMMIPHHVGAIDMARLVLQHGRDPVTRQLAEEIIVGQTVEIEGMRRRLRMLRSAGAGGRPEFPALGGVRGP